MSLDLAALGAAVAAHGRVVRVLIAGHRGSSPREAGASMLVWEGGQSGTIGGGALEWAAAARARAMAAQAAPPRVERVPLGPALGQCCGGSVTLVYEAFCAASLPRLTVRDGWAARPVEAGAAPHPPALRGRAGPRLTAGWLLEPLRPPGRPLWVWGAGHVGRAIVAMAAPLPDLAVTWVDTAPERFPEAVPDGVTVRVAADPATLVPEAPREAEHLVLTHSHALDLALCHALLRHGFAGAGLIGSASKWARFRSRLAALGHAGEAIARLRCPIGEPGLGKHPQAIAVGVLAELLRAPAAQALPAVSAG